MNWIRLYQIARTGQQRERHVVTSNAVTKAFYVLILVCSVFLFAFVTQYLDNQIAVLMNALIVYSVLGYRFEFVLSEIKLGRFHTYRTTIRQYLTVFGFLIMESNPLLPMLFAYSITYISLNITSPIRLALLLYAVTLIVTTLSARLFERELIASLMAVCLLVSLALTSVNKLSTDYHIAIFSCCLVYLVTLALRNVTAIKPLFQRDAFYFSCNLAKGIPALPAIKDYIADFYKNLLLLIVCLIGSSLSYRYLHFEALQLSPFLIVLDLELILDRKYKYLNQYLSKYYFLKNSSLTFLQRYLISESFSSLCPTLIIIIGMGISSLTSIIKIACYLIFAFLIGLIYYQFEERTFQTNRKVNTYIIQYLIFVLVSLFLALIAFIK